MTRVAPKIRQRGLAILLLVVTLLIGAASVFYGLTRVTNSEIERDRKTAAALAMAKAALIEYATSVNNFSGGQRPGDLPCPDRNDSGDIGTNTPATCGNAAGNRPERRLGRLPWKTLGLPDLRDGDGERLWYALSNNFKNATRTACTSSGAAGCLNSDSRGTITIRHSSGLILHDGNTSSGVIAVVIAPGAPLKRQGAATVQNRTCTGGACNATGRCTTTPESNTPKCNAINYLDTVTGVEDNADPFEAAGGNNGFIHGPVRDGSGNVTVNDRLITITYEDIMPRLEQRVAMEALNCLRFYSGSISTGGLTNTGRYPWATPPTSPTTTTTDLTNTLFGRFPGVPTFPLGYLNNSAASGSAMPNSWPADCTIAQGTWWNNWRDHVFFAVADAYKPGTGAPAVCGTGACLTVNPPSAAATKQVVVMVSGKTLAGQSRSSATDKQNPANYLEGNATLPVFTKQPRSNTFNDTVVFYPP